MFKKILIRITLICLPFVLGAWGGQGHYHISYRSSYFMPQSLLDVQNWAYLLAVRASDADERKGWDPTESPKHYIDIDNYPQFLSQGNIPQSYDSVIQFYGYSFVHTNGILPWATVATYDSLVKSFEQHDWNDVIYYAADIGHYVADGHMPLHLTRNYNGQFTNQYGVHSRFESTMIYHFMSQITYSGSPSGSVSNVSNYVFSYIYENYKYVDSVLLADQYAYQVAGSSSSMAYYNAMWGKSKNFVTLLFRNASKSIAELIYTAWLEAGSPVPPGYFVQGVSGTASGCTVYPNPASGELYFEVDGNQAGGTAYIIIYDSRGKQVLSSEKQTAGTEGRFGPVDVSMLSPGLYYAGIRTGETVVYKPLVITK